MDEDDKCKSASSHSPEGTDVTKTKVSQRCSSDVKKSFQVDAYEEPSLLVAEIYIAEILAIFGENRFLTSKGKLR